MDVAESNLNLLINQSIKNAGSFTLCTIHMFMVPKHRGWITGTLSEQYKSESKPIDQLAL